jgi:hypothetical protein
MKKKFISSFLTISSTLLAYEKCSTPNPSSPTKHANYECYTPSYNELQGNWGPFLSVDFLYWYARETNLSYGLTVVGVSQRPVQSFPIALPDVYSLPQTYHDMGINWKPGVRLGIGWEMPQDGWDLNLQWTYFYSARKDSAKVPPHVTPYDTVSIPGETLLLNPWVDMAVWETPFFDTISAQWNLSYNSIDLELGKKAWFSPHFAFRPYVGMRGAWTKTQWELSSTFGPFNKPYFNFMYEESYDLFTNHFWGVGPLGGVQPEWHFRSNFSLFGNFNTAFLWGEFKSQKKLDYLVTAVESQTGTFRYLEQEANKTRPRSQVSIQAILDMGIGLRWEEYWKSNRFKTSVDLGWEQHIWFDSGAYTKNTSQGGTPSDPDAQVYTRTYFDEVTNLVFGGLVAKARFDF